MNMSAASLGPLGGAEGTSASQWDDRGKRSVYADVAASLTGVFAGERNPIANAANMSAILYAALPGVNWAGFYFLNGGELVLGPFQGRVACVRIGLGKGVCGAAAARQQTVVIADVRAFPGHIACDAASRSEIVVPLMKGGRLFGVLDLDSPFLGRFDHEDQAGLERAAQCYCDSCDLADFLPA